MLQLKEDEDVGMLERVRLLQDVGRPHLEAGGAVGERGEVIPRLRMPARQRWLRHQ